MSISNNISSSVQLEPCYILRPLGFYLLFLWITGTSLNGAILYIFIRYRKIRQSSTNIFISGLILADFIGACFEIPLPAIAMIGCRWIFTYVGCVFESIIAYFAGCANMYILCLISIDRYFIVTSSFPSQFLSIKQTYFSILSAYLLSLLWTLMPILGWSSYDYEGTGASCSIKWEDRSVNVMSYNMTILVFVYIIPVTIIIITNIHVSKTIRERRRCTNINLSATHIRRQFYVERRITHTVTFIIGGFLLAWTPYAVAVCIRVFINADMFPPLLGTLPAVFAKTSVVWNPFIYIVRNGNFRQFLPFYTTRRISRNKKNSDQTRFSVYPYSAVHLPLPSPASLEET